MFDSLEEQIKKDDEREVSQPNGSYAEFPERPTSEVKRAVAI